MSNTAKETHSDRIIGLDVVRFFAIMIVVIYHSVPLLAPLTGVPVIGRPLHYLFALTEPFGILGVELFFALSGFLIGSILIKVYLRSQQFALPEISSFLVRRWFRTLPNYWLILIANFAVYAALGFHSFQASDIRYFFFVQNLTSPHPPFFPEAWSLAIEEWFYLTAPMALLAVSLLFRKSEKKRVLAITLLAYPILFLIVRAVAIDNNNPDPLYFDHSVRKVVMLRLSAISYGVLIAFARLFYSEAIEKLKMPLFLTGLLGIGALTAIHYIGIHPGFALYAKSHSYRVFHNVLLISLIPLCSALLLPYAYGVRALRSKRVGSTVTFISKISYSLYLVHFTLILESAMPFLHLTVSNCVPIYVGYWAVIIGLSATIYKYYEMPMMHLRNRFSKADPNV
ncbi:MAG: acyltransferase [Taibaiella sp.]|nr:acyltransferase [Taibaiella sp.]